MISRPLGRRPLSTGTYYSILCSLLLKSVWPIFVSPSSLSCLRFCICPSLCLKRSSPRQPCGWFLSYGLCSVVLYQWSLCSLTISDLSLHPGPVHFPLCLIFIHGIHYHLAFVPPLESLKFLWAQRWVCSILFTPIPPLTQIVHIVVQLIFVEWIMFINEPLHFFRLYHKVLHIT